MNVTPTNHLVSVRVADLERLEFSGVRNTDGTLAWNGVTYTDWPERVEVCGVEFRLEETDDHERYTPDDAPEGTTGSMGWYVPYDPGE